MHRSYQAIVPVGTSPTLVLAANPHRSAWLLSNNGPSPVVITVGQQPSNNQGVILLPGARPIEFDREYFGNWVGLDVWAQTASGLSLGFQYPVSLQGHALSAAATGVVLSGVVGGTAPQILTGATVSADIGDTCVIGLEVLRAATTYTIFQFNPGGAFSGQFALITGDTVQLDVTTAQALKTFDGTITYTTASEAAESTAATLVVWAAEHCGML